MAHILNTMARKQAANEAGNYETTYRKYKNLVARAQEHDTNEQIIAELEAELERVKRDEREGDAIFQQGLTNVKSACIVSLKSLIEELRSK